MHAPFFALAEPKIRCKTVDEKNSATQYGMNLPH